MIDSIIELLTISQTWWLDLLKPYTSPTSLIVSLIALSAVALFFILRDQYKKYERMWIIEGIEIMGAGAIGAVVLSAVYSVPLIIFAILAACFIMGIVSVFQFLVVVSVKGVKG